MIKSYYWLTKPGIIYGNAITAVGGFLLASKGHFDWKLFLAMLVGLSLVIASACVVNNIFDVDIDSKMDRTKHRATVTGKVSKKSAIIFASILLILGVITLHFHTTLWALLTAMLGFVVYVGVYTPLKSKTTHATLVGSISGATPPAVGYLAVTNNLDLAAVLLFVILVAWQMPHFYSIAIFRLEEYKAAAVPVLPAIKGIALTKKIILAYILVFLIAITLLTIYNYTGYYYLSILGLVSLRWLSIAVQGFKTNNDQLWARKLFKFSLFVLLTFSVMISLNPVI